jgi:hypothetical protein
LEKNYEGNGRRHTEASIAGTTPAVSTEGSSGDIAALSRWQMEQFWLREKEVGVIFLMSVDSVDEADRLLKSLPLGQANLLTFDLMPVGPLLPLGMLMAAK